MLISLLHAILDHSIFTIEKKLQKFPCKTLGVKPYYIGTSLKSMEGKKDTAKNMQRCCISKENHNNQH